MQINCSDQNQNKLQNGSITLDQGQFQNDQVNSRRIPSAYKIRMTGQNQGQSCVEPKYLTLILKPCSINFNSPELEKVYKQERIISFEQKKIQSDSPTETKVSLQSGHIAASQFRAHVGSERYKKIIMVVDDSQTVRNLMAVILHRAGYHSVRVASAVEALHTLTELIPDLIFLDITLPGMDGIDICKIIKENPQTKQIPVVMMSGNNEVFDKVMGRLAGASDYITKPFEPETIINCVKTLALRQ